MSNYLNNNKKEKLLNDKDFDIYKNKKNSFKEKNPNAKIADLDISIYQTIIDIIGLNNNFSLNIYLITGLFIIGDGGEMIVLSLILTKVSDDWGLTPTLKGLLGSSVFIGVFIGALICGRFSDVKGRRPMIIIGSLLVFVFSLFSAFCNNYLSFFICRGLCGVGIGLSIPSASSLSLEITPTNLRHLVILILNFTFPIGEIIVIIIAKLIFPFEWGWRYLLALSSIPCFIAFIISLKINESPKFLLTNKRFEEGFESLENLISSSGKDFSLSEKMKDKLKEEFNNYNKSLEEDFIEENSKGFIESLKDLFNFSRKFEINKEHNEEHSLKKLNELLSKDNNHKDKKSQLDKNNNDFFDLTSNDSNDSNTKHKKSFNILNKENISPKFNIKDLFNKKYKFLTFMIWILFTMCSIVFYGMIYILPQILEKIEHNKNLDNTNKINNPINNNANGKISNEEMSFNSFIQLLISALMQIPSTILGTYLVTFGRIKSMALGFFFCFFFTLICLVSDNWFFIGIAFAKFFICISDMISMLYVCEAYPTKIRVLGIGAANSFYRIGGMLTPFINQLLFEFYYLAPYVFFNIGSLIGFFATVNLPFESVGKNIR